MKEFKKAGDKVTIEDVYESCRRYITNEDDMKLIKKAYDYIMVKHEGQKRKSGEPYTIHLIRVAYIYQHYKQDHLPLQRVFYTMSWKIVMYHVKKW